MIEELAKLQDEAIKMQQTYANRLEKVHHEYYESALNLVHYLAIRKFDIRNLQQQLGQMGISRLGKAEGHVMASLLAIKDQLHKIEGSTRPQNGLPYISINEASEKLERHASLLLGSRPSQRRVRVMVTFPSTAAEDYEWVKKSIKAGANCVRINCAHDDEQVWLGMINNIKQAEIELGRSVKICMDLGGPKLRTGSIEPGPEVIRVKPKRDTLGRVIETAKIWFAPQHSQQPFPKADYNHIPVLLSWLYQLEVGDEITLRDARDKKRRYTIIEVLKEGVVAESDQTTYFTSGTLLSHKRGKKHISESYVLSLPALEQSIPLSAGDTLIIHLDPREGQAADPDNDITAHISCSIPELYKDARIGERILLDDGKISGTIQQVENNEIHLRIDYAGLMGSKLKADKGINLPDTHLNISGLTEKDKSDLPFVVQYADVVNLSFVNTEQDVYDLMDSLKELNAREDLGIVLKIETKNGVQHLPSILLGAMQHSPLGVMIARGDLAVECGWDRLAEIQEEILRICEAAHVPNIWATQVLESLAKMGLPSRAEITDAAMSQRAECVMLNKGPFIHETIKMLDKILRHMQEYQRKKAPMLPMLQMPTK